MPHTRHASDPQVITTAARGRTPDVDERERRYFITMTIRTLCFFAFLVVPGWWKIVAIIGAAFLPIIAVLLANNSDHRPPPVATDEDDEGARLALPASEVIKGVVEDDE